MRIVKNFSEIKDMSTFINSVVINPVASELNSAKASLSSVDSSINQTNRDIVNYETSLLDLKRKILLYESEKIRLKKKADILEKIANRSVNTDVLEKLDASKFDAFLRPLGLRFFACHSVGSNADAVYFYFTRETKKISYVVTPPLMLRIRYGWTRDYNTYVLTEVRAMPLVHYQSQDYYVHPHINSSSDVFKSLCLGNYFDILKRAKVPTTFSNWQDHCLLVDQLLNTYNPDSPYIRIDELARNIRTYGYKINDRDNTGNYINIDTSAKFVILAEGLTQMQQYNPENILTKGMFDRFENMVHDIDTISLIGDAIAELTTIYYLDEVETYERVLAFHGSVGLEIEGFHEPSDWGDYDDDNDQYYITEDSFDELKSSWLTALRQAGSKKLSFSVPKMSRETYASYFGEEEKEEVTTAVESTVIVEGE